MVGQFWPKVEDDILQTIQVYLQQLCACKAIEFSEIKQNKGYNAVQGHSVSMSVPIDRPYATSY